jgi:rhodanese-related sulfurtransferase
MTAKKLCISAILGLLIATLVLLSGCSEGEETQIPGQVIEDVSLEEAFTLMEDNRGSHDFMIIDLRSAAEYAGGHIEAAVNIDYSAADFAEALDELDRDKVYLLYSRKDDISGQVLDMMAELGFAEVYNMLGGMEHWEKIGLPRVK